MLFVHAHSEIEHELCLHVSYGMKNISVLKSTQEINSQLLENIHFVNPIETIVYSFLDFKKYDYLPSFQKEVNNIKQILSFAKEHDTKHIVLISYPGAYINSDNLFLQHKGMIENLVVQSNIHYTILCVQNVSNYEKGVHAIHSLFYSSLENRFIIPRKRNDGVYCVDVKNLAEIILKISPTAYKNSFDVVDRVMRLHDIMHDNPEQLYVEKIYPVYLHVMSALGTMMSPTMLDLFLRPTVPMFAARAEKEFELSLFQESLQFNTSKETNDFMQVQPSFL